MQVVAWLLLVVAVTLVAARLGAFAGRPPEHLGLREGKLEPPSKTPNSVSSQAGLWPDHPQRDAAYVAPFALQRDGPATIARLVQVIEDMDGTRIVERRPDYLCAQFTTKLLRFVDDAEFWFDAAGGVIQVRSASRIGSNDYGTNRARIEAIRERLAAAA